MVFQFPTINVNQTEAFNEAVSWIVDTFSRAEAKASKYISKSGPASEVGLDYLLLEELIDLEVPRTFRDAVTARVIAEYIGGTRQRKGKEIADILLNVEFRYADFGETLSKLVFLQSKKLVPTPARWRSRTFEDLIAGKFLDTTVFRYSRNSKVSEMGPKQRELVNQFGHFVYYMLHCPWDIKTVVTRPTENPATFSANGSGGCRIFRPGQIGTQTKLTFSKIESISKRLPEFIEDLLTCKEGRLFLQKERDGKIEVLPVPSSEVVKKYFAQMYMQYKMDQSLYPQWLEPDHLKKLAKKAISVSICFKFKGVNSVLADEL